MKLKWIIPLLIIACAVCASAFADVWNGSVAAATEVEIIIPADGTLDTFDLTVGQTVSTGDVVGHIRETKVFSPIDGEVAAVHLETGDKADGTVIEIAPVSLYLLTCTAENTAKTPENALIHIGEQVYVKCTADGSHRAIARVTALDGMDYEAEVIGGELYVGESVFIYRDRNFAQSSQIGKGTVTSQETLPVAGEGVILQLRVGIGDRVERGQWLFSTASSSKTDIIAQADGVITSVSVEIGSQVHEDQTAAVIATGISLRVDVSADDAPRFRKGARWYYTRSDDPHETLLPATVRSVLLNEKDASATVVLIPDEKVIPIGLGISLTDEIEN